MKAVACKEAELSVVERETPTPGKGQVLVDVLRCGICGSDLHARHHTDELGAVMEETGYDGVISASQEIVFGHEFCGEIVDHGPGSRKDAPSGTHVVAFPLLRTGGAVHGIGLSAQAPGAYAEHLLIEESLAVPVPNGLGPDLAALTEPMAVGWHAVRRGEVKKGTVAIVVGCGPVGLAVISLLKARGVRTIVASDYSPGRRALATACGAHIVIDPAEDSPFDKPADSGHIDTAPGILELAVGTVEKIRRVPKGEWQIWRAIDRLGIKPKSPVIFECVGVPGVIDEIIAGAPFFSRVVVVGVCMGEDRIRPSMAINKEIELRFVIGYTPLEFRDTLHMLAEGKVNATPMVTGVVGLDGVDAAFTALGDPETHAKILIDPRSAATEPEKVSLPRAEVRSPA